jgi:hypothetical protein
MRNRKDVKYARARKVALEIEIVEKKSPYTNTVYTQTAYDELLVRATPGRS